MNSNVKKILLAGTALVAVSMIGSGAANAQVTQVNGSDQVVTAPSTGVNFVTNNAANVDAGGVAIGDVAGASVTVGTGGFGTLHFQGGTNSVSGTIGAGNAVGGIQVSGNATVNIASGTVNTNNFGFGVGGGTLNLNSAVTSGAALHFGANAGVINFTAGSTYSGTAQGTNAGTINFMGASNAQTAFLGTNGNSLGIINMTAGMTGTLANRVYATNVNITGAGTTTFGAGITGILNLNHASAIGVISADQSITGSVASNSVSNGELRFAGNGSVSGTTGVGTLRLDGVGGTTVTLSDTATINTLTLNSNGNLTFGNGGSVTTGVNNATTGTIRNNGGTLTFTGGLTATNATL